MIFLLLIPIVILILLTSIVMIRNEKVFKYRSKVIFYNKIGDYEKLPSYYVMVFKFWIPLNDKNWIK